MNKNNLSQIVTPEKISISSLEDSKRKVLEFSRDIQNLNIDPKDRTFRLRGREIVKGTYVPRKRNPKKLNFAGESTGETFLGSKMASSGSETEEQNPSNRVGSGVGSREKETSKIDNELVQKVVEELSLKLNLQGLSTLLQNLSNNGAGTSTASQDVATNSRSSLSNRRNPERFEGHNGGNDPNNPNNRNHDNLGRVVEENQINENGVQQLALHFQKMRQSALAAAMNIKEFKPISYRTFLNEIENIISIYNIDEQCISIILKTATQKVNNPLIRERKFEEFSELRLAIESICSTKMDYRSYTNEISNAAQASKQSVEKFGEYIAKLLQNQIAAYLQDDRIAIRPKEYQEEDLERFSKVAAMNFVEGISIKHEKLKERLQNKEFDSLQEAINEAKRVAKQLENERKRATAKRNEEFLSSRNSKFSNFKHNKKFQNNAKPTFKQGSVPAKYDKPKERICYNCLKPGHIAPSCPEPKRKRENGQNSQNPQPSGSQNSQPTGNRYVRTLQAGEFDENDFEQKNWRAPATQQPENVMYFQPRHRQ